MAVTASPPWQTEIVASACDKCLAEEVDSQLPVVHRAIGSARERCQAPLFRRARGRKFLTPFPPRTSPVDLTGGRLSLAPARVNMGSVPETLGRISGPVSLSPAGRPEGPATSLRILLRCMKGAPWVQFPK